MKKPFRVALFVLSAAVLTVIILAGAAGLPEFGSYPGPYGDLVIASAIPDRHVTNVPTSVNFDYRGLDTLGEEYILFAAVAALALLLRKEPGSGHTRRKLDYRAPEPIEATGLLLFGPMIVFGIYVVLHGAITPGGGFHGGVICGTAWLLLYMTAGALKFARLTPRKIIDFIESVGAGAYAVIGAAALATGGVFLENFLPLGKTGEITAGGTISLINFFVGLEVAAAFILVFSEFVREIHQE